MDGQSGISPKNNKNDIATNISMNIVQGIK